MKIRNGFVSNSSSSSFLIKLGEEYPNVLSVAESMVKDKFDAWREWDKDDKRVIRYNDLENTAYKNIERLKRIGDVNIPIFFHSTNYDTYILPILDKYVYVDTCNNVFWSIQNSASSTYQLPLELQELYPNTELGDGGGELGREKRNYEYYLIEVGLLAEPAKEYNTCKKCRNEVWYINDVEYCLYCDGSKITRGLKLNKIKNIINDMKLYLNNKE